jgi:hypothetical protein
MGAALLRLEIEISAQELIEAKKTTERPSH